MAEIEKLDLASRDIAAERRAELARLFPEARIEGGKIDFERLRLTLGEAVDAGKERYGLTWPGKAACFKTIQAPSRATLRPAPEESVNFDTSENLIIEGDNLEVLKLLQKSYLGKIKMIYIDPPYNTGNDFIYPDDYSESLETYLAYTHQTDTNGRKWGTNTDTDGRFHSKWLNMMYPRLYLARNLLREDGVICVSINSVEIANLIALMDEIFGSENQEAVITWRRRHNQPNDPSKMIATVAEYILVYARDSEKLKADRAFYGIPLSDARRAAYRNHDQDARGVWDSKPWKAGSGQSGSRYKIVTPAGKILDEEWLGSPETFDKFLKENLIHWPKNGDGLPRKKFFLSDRDASGQAAHNFWGHEQFGSNQEASAELAVLMDEKGVFDNPKPVSLIKAFIGLTTSDGDIVLDFFCGSATTAQSTLEMNNADAKRRKFILVQLPEPTDRSDYPTIADIAKERVRRVISKLNDDACSKLNLEEEPKQKYGFRVFKLAESNFKTWEADAPQDANALERQLELHVNHIRDGRTELDMLYEILLKSGFSLSEPIERLDIEGKTVYSVSGGAFLLCLDRALTFELIHVMAERKPERIVCLDEGFAGNDQLKVNAAETFRMRGVTSFRTV